MDIYEQIIDSFGRLPGVCNWHEVQGLFQEIAIRKPEHWLLPVCACEAVGGNLDQAIPAALAVACSHISIILVDDMLDCDPRGAYHQLGAPAAANMASALQAAALAAVASALCKQDNRLMALDCLNSMMLTTTLGQYWDVQGAQFIVDEARYWQVVRTKSSPFFGAALEIGALLGGASHQVAGQLGALGALYGEMVQIHDDVSDSLSMPANPDWLLERCPLPILFARQVEHPDRERFLVLSQQVADAAALAEAQEILIGCGAVSYCMEQLLIRHKAMQAILASTLLHKRAGIDALAQAVITPVWQLLGEIESWPIFKANVREGQV